MNCWKGLYNMIVNIRSKYSRIVFKISLIGGTFININSMDSWLNDLNPSAVVNGINAAFNVLKGNIEGALNDISAFIFINEGNDVIPSEYKSNTLCILLHGVGGTADKFYSDMAAEVGNLFGGDVISLEYNYFDINKIKASAEELVAKIEVIENIRDKRIIIIGYSLGVNVGAVVASILKAKGYSFDFIGYKGYKNIYSIADVHVPGTSGIIRKFANKNNAAKQLVEMTDNAALLGGLGFRVGLLNEGLAEGHAYTSGDVSAIYNAYTNLKGGDMSRPLILLCQTQNDGVVGDGMTQTYNEITRNLSSGGNSSGMGAGARVSNGTSIGKTCGSEDTGKNSDSTNSVGDERPVESIDGVGIFDCCQCN